MQKDQYGNVNILLLGYGGAGHDGGLLTDSIMVVSRNPEVGNISMFSIPRDLWVKDPRGGYGRINALYYSYLRKYSDDVALAVSGVATDIGQMLSMQIPYYATIDFTAFQAVVDSIGGIDVVVPETLHDTTYPNEENRGYITFHLDAGLQHLDGATALKYARSRHSTSDFSRSLRQQLIIKAIKDKLFASGLDLSRVPELYEQYQTYVKTNVSLQEMLRSVQYIKSLGEFASYGFTTNCSFQNFLKMPPACFLYYPNREAFGGASVILPMDATVNNIQHYQGMQTFTTFLITHPAFVKEKASIEILNGIDKAVARSKGMSTTPFAGQFAVKLKRYGFNVVTADNAESPSSGTYVVIHGDRDLTASVEALQVFLSVQDIRYDTGSVLTGIDLSGNVYSYVNGAEISVVLGEDYLLGSEVMSGLVERKFSYDLKI